MHPFDIAPGLSEDDVEREWLGRPERMLHEFIALKGQLAENGPEPYLDHLCGEVDGLMSRRKRTPKPGPRLDRLIERQLDKRRELRDRWDLARPRRELGDALARLRARAGLTQTQVAEVAGWDQPYVSKMESAEGPWPSAASLDKFARACNSGVGWVFLQEQEGTVITVGSAFVGTRRVREAFDQLVDESEVVKKGS